jgi:trans-aconitate methyltransferase
MQHSTDKPMWDPTRISTTWFDSHFNHAAQRVIEWLSPEMQLEAPVNLMDFGCGGGITTLGVALRYPGVQVHGVDIGDKYLQLPELAQEQLNLQALPENLHLRQIWPLQPLAQSYNTNAIFSWSVFEHIPQSQIPTIMQDLYDMLPVGGLFFLQIEPLYYSPWGSHHRRFIDMPWAHLLWSSDELRNAVLAYDGDIPPQHQGHQYRALDMQAFKHFHLGEYDSLNKVTADQMTGFMLGAGFEIIRQQSLQLNLEIPEDLLKRYNAQDLLTNGILLLARK